MRGRDVYVDVDMDTCGRRCVMCGMPMTEKGGRVRPGGYIAVRGWAGTGRDDEENGGDATRRAICDVGADV